MCRKERKTHKNERERERERERKKKKRMKEQERERERERETSNLRVHLLSNNLSSLTVDTRDFDILDLGRSNPSLNGMNVNALDETLLSVDLHRGHRLTIGVQREGNGLLGDSDKGNSVCTFFFSGLGAHTSRAGRGKRNRG